MDQKRWVFLFFVFIPLLALWSCVTTGPGPDTITPEQLPGISGIEWQLTELVVDGESRDLIPEARVTLNIDPEGKVSGLASINRYFGGFTMDSKGGITWPAHGFGATRMAGPPELMDQETAFLNALASTTGVYEDKSSLVFSDETGTLRLVFKKIKKTVP